jgi:hypothetical protein
VSGGIFYTYNAPGEAHGQTAYGEDLLSMRLALKHVLSERLGFGYFFELATFNPMAFRVDGHPVNTAPETIFPCSFLPGCC